jgi:hypothetical protein
VEVGVRKPDEIEFYRRLREIAPLPYVSPGRSAVEAMADAMGMSHRRAESLMEKWSAKGYMDYGVSPVQGWFEPDAPVSLGP